MTMRGTGIISRWCDRGYGFATRTGARDIFVHVKDLPEGFKELEVGQRISFIEAPDREGKMRAADVQLI